MAKVNIGDVAARAGVSKATVSNFLNSRFGKLSPETQERIKAVIRELDYYPNLGAQRLSRKEDSHTIGIILEQTSIIDIFSTLFFSHVMAGVSEGLDEFGYRSLLITGGSKDPDEEIAYVKSLSSMVDGFMLYNVQEMDRFVEEFERSRITYVCVGRIIGSDSRNYVATDYRAGIKEGMEHLIGLGHRRIAMFVGCPRSIVTIQMRQGYLAALKDAGIEADKSLIVESESNTADLYDVATELLETKKPTAFIVSQPQAQGVHKAIERKQLKVPRDISIMLSQHYEASTYEKYDYTYLEAQFRKVGYNAVSLFNEYARGTATAQSGKLSFPMRLVVGKTTGRCSG